ncbi:MAG: hypothetical protein Q8L84_16385 [Hyphomonas sp.]|nr:hypothetical protein [Hyphomonas sp.]
MIPMRAFRADPHFADLFAHVPVICWPILWWQLNALFRWCKREGRPDVLYSVSPWGFITLRHAGDRPDPATYKPLPRTFRPLTDDSWGSDLPSGLKLLSLSEATGDALFLPRKAQGCPGNDSLGRGAWPARVSECLYFRVVETRKERPGHAVSSYRVCRAAQAGLPAPVRGLCGAP